MRVTDPGLLWASGSYKAKVQLGCLLVAYVLTSLWGRARTPTHLKASLRAEDFFFFFILGEKCLVSPGVAGSRGVVLGLVEEFSSPGGKKRFLVESDVST